MEDKIKRACECIVALGEDYTLRDWHEACIKIIDLGVTKETLMQYVNEHIEEYALNDLHNGNYCQAANYIMNFMMWNDSIPWIKCFYPYIVDFVDYVRKDKQNGRNERE